MIERIEIAGVHTTVTDDIRKYVVRKLGRADRYVARPFRESVHLEVKLKEGKAKDKNDRTCEIILHLPQETITLSETTVNMFAAVDIVEAKLRQQLKRYKETHGNPRFHRRLISRFQRSAPETS
jgi:ribosomal subunit interface protein